MDSNFPGISNFINGYQFDDDGSVEVSDPNQYGSLLNFASVDPFYDADPIAFAPHTSVNSEGEGFVSSSTESPVDVSSNSNSRASVSVVDPSLEDTDFSEAVKFISQILMEENVELEQRPFYDPLSLQGTEQSFYDALRQNLPLSPTQHPLDIHQHVESPDTNSADTAQEYQSPSLDTPVSGDNAFQFKSNPISHDNQPPPNAFSSISNGLLDLDSSITKLLAQNIFSDADSVSQFRRGLEEASKFLPRGPQLVTGLENNMVPVESKREEEKSSLSIGRAVGENSQGLKSRKNHERDSNDIEEGRNNKQSAVGVSVDENEISEMFDRVLLSVENLPICGEHSCSQNGEPVKAAQPGEQPNSSERGKTPTPRKQGKKKETIDLRTLLILCAQAVSANDSRTANELLKQVRQHSSPSGDASQRLAHYFANGLEARLVGDGSGSQIFYTSLSIKKISAADFLKGYQVYLSTCPFKKFAHFFANKMIKKAAEKEETLHIIDFGILYGFQWPLLIKFLANREGGPPKLRITGIEFPQPGFRPSERIEETGRRLERYCKQFGVPFEYKAIASRNWETIQIEDLKIERNEVLAVNCMMRFKNLLDETIEVNSPRNAVLNLIRKMKPNIFVQSIVNGSYNTPFFATRFREALFHFSAIYDMCDTVMPRANDWRMMIEREILGREAMNAIACEGFERLERPETFKRWQARNTRAGFRQLPLDKELMAKFREKSRAWYHRDFVFDEDNNWMLQGWKGRILYASTCWVPA